MNVQDLKSEWARDKEWIDTYTRDFTTLEGLADGVAVSNQKGAPQVGSVTLANSVRQIPRSSVQNVPVLSMEINGTKNSVDAIIASYLLRRVVFNEDTFGNGILSTMQMAAQTALTTGFVVMRANVGKIFNQFSTMLETIHYNDIAIERGVFDASNSKHYYVRTRVTKLALKDVLDAAKENPDTLWNVKGLQELYDAGPQAFDTNTLISRPRQTGGQTGEDYYDIITRYGVGSYYPIDVFSPQQMGDKPLMSIKSKSKFGYPRVSMLVIDPAQLTPFGISRARLASPMSNYGNIYLQSTAKMQLLNADPPMFKRGLFTSSTPLRRGAVYESVDPNSDIRLMEMSNSTLEQFGGVMNYIDGNILSVMGVSGIGAPAQNSAYQNSDAVQAQNQTRDLASQQVTSIIENAIRQYGITAFDLYVSEQVGQTALIVDDEAKDAINLIEGEGFVGDDNVVNVDWEAYYDRIQTMTAKVDLSISPDAMADKKRADLQDTFVTMKQNAATPEAAAKADVVGDELVKDVLPDVSKSFEKIAPDLQTMTPQTAPPQAQ